MLFNSLSFVLFLLVVFAVYWLIPAKHRWFVLLMGSYYFYMCWECSYIILIVGTTLVTFFAGLALENTTSQNKKKLIVVGMLTCCLGVLFVFKYLTYFVGIVSKALSLFTIKIPPFTSRLLLPVGISFYTFQTLSYVIDIYRGDIKAEHHFGKYAAFISFFPQLVAGPIERTKNLLPQIKTAQSFDYDLAMAGGRLILIGYFKKLVVADNLAVYVDKVYNSLHEMSGFSLLIASIFFALQIYCDFSGYSDIARGTAYLFGIRLMENFKVPYFSMNLHEFWKRWHISLSTWFRDYVYIPLGGNRKGIFRTNVNLLVTFLVSGLWHGANTTYVIWGAIHGIGQIIENALGISRWQGKIVLIFHRCIMLIFIFFAWVFFRAQTMSDAIYVLKNMFVGIAKPGQYISGGFSAMSLGVTMLLTIVVIYLCPLFLIDFVTYRSDLKEKVALVLKDTGKKTITIISFLIISILIIVFSPKGVAAEFVYFQF